MKDTERNHNAWVISTLLTLIVVYSMILQTSYSKIIGIISFIILLIVVTNLKFTKLKNGNN